MLSLREGVKIDDPSITVPWGLSKRKLVGLLGPLGLRKLRSGKYSLECTAFAGLAVEMWIRYDIYFGRKKYSIGFGQTSPTNLDEDYARFDRQLAAAFGLPGRSEFQSPGLPPNQSWMIDGFVVSHYVHAQDESREYVTITPAKPGLIGRFCDFARWLVNVYFEIPLYWMLIIAAVAAVALLLRR